MIDTTEDTLLGGAVRLLQPRRGHRAGTDAVVLAALAAPRPGDHVVDLGSASGAAGLMVAAREPGATVCLVERDPVLVDLAWRNVGLNALDGRVGALRIDVFSPAPERIRGGLVCDAADLVVTNPPFFGPDKAQGRGSPDPGRRAAHAMAGGDLTGWIDTAAHVLRSGGRIVMIHRADHLGACLPPLLARFGGVCLTAIHPRCGAAASRVLLSGVKGSRATLSITPPLVLHEADGTFTPEADALHRRP